MICVERVSCAWVGLFVTRLAVIEYLSADVGEEKLSSRVGATNWSPAAAVTCDFGRHTMSPLQFDCVVRLTPPFAARTRREASLDRFAGFFG